MAGVFYEFGPFRLDMPGGGLTNGDETVALPYRHRVVLGHLLATAGEVVSKDALIAAAWDVAVTDNSLEQVISSLRRALGPGPGSDGRWIETVARRGYRFTGVVRTRVGREPDEALDALLAPHRAFIEGRAALETLDASRVDEAHAAFERVVRDAPDQAAAHIGLANACVMRFETTRAHPDPDRAALEAALRHAREACSLDPQSGEAWATLGLALERAGATLDALAAARRAVTLEPDNWRHHFRLSSIAWGEERLRSAHRTLALLPGFPLAHWMAATVHVARQAVDEAARELESGLAAEAPGRGPEPSSFHPVALHWLRGLLHLSRGAVDRAMADFEAELAGERTRHLYAREAAANTWYAIGVVHRREGRADEAATAFARALERVPEHPLARVCLGGDATTVPARVAGFALDGQADAAARLVEHALAEAPPGNAFWILPVEPLLAVHARPDLWAPALNRLRVRAA
jgi:DNA-binding winged helix-turn-helix (wHTH) protein